MCIAAGPRTLSANATPPPSPPSRFPPCTLSKTKIPHHAHTRTYPRTHARTHLRTQAQGNAAFSAGNFAEAVEHFTAAIGVDSANHVFYSNRSAAHAALENFDAALTDADKTVEVKPDWAKGRVHDVRRSVA